MDTKYIKSKCCDIEKFICSNNLEGLRKTNSKLLYKKVKCEFKEFNRKYPQIFNNVINGNYKHIDKLLDLISKFS
jgi:hypothetical protein